MPGFNPARRQAILFDIFDIAITDGQYATVTGQIANIFNKAVDQQLFSGSDRLFALHIHHKTFLPRPFSGGILDDICITVVLKLESQLPITRLDDLTLVENMHAVRDNILQQALVVRNDNE